MLYTLLNIKKKTVCWVKSNVTNHMGKQALTCTADGHIHCSAHVRGNLAVRRDPANLPSVILPQGTYMALHFFVVAELQAIKVHHSGSG